MMTFLGSTIVAVEMRVDKLIYPREITPPVIVKSPPSDHNYPHEIAPPFFVKLLPP